MTTTQLWKTVLSDLEVSLSRGNFMTWMAPTHLVRVQQVDVGRQIVEIACSSAYHKQFIEERYVGQIKEALDRITKQNNELVLTVASFTASPPVPDSHDTPLFRSEDNFVQLYHEAVLRVRLREDFTFETFAVSSSNEMAHAAAQAVAKSPGQAYNLLYIYGGVGVGKTHLTQAICHVMLQKHPDLSLIYCTGEEFTNEIIEAIRRKETHPFKKKYRSVSALFIDDIQFIAGKATVQEEFFHTFNAIQREGGQVVLVSDQPPHAIDSLEDRLRSRFEGGLIIDIQQPNFELRTAILLIKARTLHVSLPIDAAKLIAANVESARKLEGFLTRLVSESRLRNQTISEELVRGLLTNLNDREARLQPTARPKEVIHIVASYFNLKSAILEGPRRLKSYVAPRHLAMYILRMDHHLPLEEIGVLFGGRDHTTVMHAIEKISNELSDSESLRIDLSNIRKKIYG